MDNDLLRYYCQSFVGGEIMGLTAAYYNFMEQAAKYAFDRKRAWQCFLLARKLLLLFDCENEKEV